MGIDGKYGRVTTERGTIGEDEPVVVFRAQDRLLPKLLKVYWYLCELAGSPAHHLSAIDGAAREVKAWQAANPTKTPSSDSLAPQNAAAEAPPAGAKADETVRGLAQDVANTLAAVLSDDELTKVFAALDALWSTPPHGTLRPHAPYGAGTLMLALSDVLPGEAVTR